MFRPYLRVLRTPSVPVLLTAGFLGALPIGMLSLGVLMLVRSGTGSFAAAGLVTGSLSAGNALGLLAQGQLIDRAGQTRVLVGFGLGCVAALAALTALVHANAPLPLVCLCAGLAGAGIPATTSSLRVLLADLPMPPESRTTAYALVATQFQVAMVTGPLLASALLLLAGPEAVVWSAAGLAGMAGVVFAMTAASRRWQPAPRPQAPARAPSPSRTWRSWRGSGLATVVVTNAGGGFANGLLTVGVPAACVAAGSPALAGLLFSASSLGDLGGGVVYGGRPSRLPYARQLVLGRLVLGAAIGLQGLLVQAPVGMLPLMFLVGAVNAPVAIASSAVLDDLAPPGALARAYTTTVAASLLGAAAGSAAGGALERLWGPWSLYVLGCVLMTATAVVTWLRRRTLADPATVDPALGGPALGDPATGDPAPRRSSWRPNRRSGPRAR
ncbi:Predicted arabinose efflux permease, MFS family [Actinopolymorpha cephalotaxi]|uniref:Predicted arabinose efflux permease, MFS family n=1 Tax=Actinopolymorpha cephalotaxi TaxID=504797 RepID=A0A1I2VC01_9ACTN|nr:Predicted arabinose efflux permease, MFS family [Actinopolymorpha cephalotaxi]